MLSRLVSCSSVRSLCTVSRSSFKPCFTTPFFTRSFSTESLQQRFTDATYQDGQKIATNLTGDETVQLLTNNCVIVELCVFMNLSVLFVLFVRFGCCSKCSWSINWLVIRNAKKIRFIWSKKTSTNTSGRQTLRLRIEQWHPAELAVCLSLLCFRMFLITNTFVKSANID